MKTFFDQTGSMALAHAEVPDTYETGGELNRNRQSAAVPFTFNIHAVNKEKRIGMFILSEEMFCEPRSQLAKLGVNNDPAVIRSSLRPFIEPGDYLLETAQQIFGAPLTPVAQTDLPSRNTQNKEANYQKMMDLVNIYVSFDNQMGTPTKVGNTIYNGVLAKYAGNKNGTGCVVMAGMDYKGYEYYTNMNMGSLMGGMGGLLGGMLGGMQQQNQGARDPRFGHGDPCDMVYWGSEARYVLVAPAEFEAEAANDFVKFIASYQPDPALMQQFDQLVMQSVQQNQQYSMQMQGMAQQSMMRTQQMQQQTAQMISQNSRDISAGIMDSWDKKMASQTRMSNNYSEAIRGVNTYQTTTGQNVEVSVAADHAYENQYGDVYGVSGPAPDDDILSKLNWTEINQK